MWVSEIKEENLTDEIVDSLLFAGLQDQGEKADCIVVLGSIKAAKYRVPRAAKAYFEKRAGKIMLCGGAMRNFPGEVMAEAEHMKQKALELGIPEEDIIMECNSQNTVENILCALLELQRAIWLNRVKSVLLVTTAYHMRRSLHIARYLFPEHIEVLPCPADDTNTKRDNWMLTEEGRKRAKGEVYNIVRCVKNGVFPDFEIQGSFDEMVCERK